MQLKRERIKDELAAAAEYKAWFENLSPERKTEERRRKRNAKK